MKKITVTTVLVMTMIVNAFSQKATIELTFTADSNGQHVPLNSILIENLTQGGDTTLYAPDTVLSLEYSLGINDSELSNNTFSISQNYPNPMEGKTTVSLYLPARENVLITVNDMMGRELLRQEHQLDHGNHSFIFFPGHKSIYFLNAQINRQSRTIKMVNTLSKSSNSGICKLEYNGQLTGMNEYKTRNALINFVFSPSDQLKFTASSSLGERIITSSPTDDQTYYFHYTGDPCPGTPTVTDIDGNTYNTVQIGDQCWMKENLKTTTYRNGIAIPNVTDANAWANLTTGAYVWYDNDISWKDKYGALYNWFVTIDAKGLCPTGWHVPMHYEWTALTDYIGGTEPPHGNELKSCRQVNSPLGGGCNTSEHPRWNEHNTHYGTDDYGFSGLPGGFRNGYGTFYSISSIGFWWSSTESSFFYAWYRGLNYDSGYVNVYDYDKQAGRSIRCLRD